MKRTPRKMSGLGVAIFVFGAWLSGPVGAAGQTARPARARGGSLWQQWQDTNSALKQHGVRLGGWVQMDGSSVAAGGEPNADAFIGQYLIDLTATVDTDKLLHWPGGTLYVEGESHSGSSVGQKQFPAIQEPDNMDARAHTWLAQLYYQQNLLHDRVQTQAGLMYGGTRFVSFPYGSHFISLNFNADGAVSTFVLPTYPKGAWGGDVTVVPVKGLSFAGGAYEDDATHVGYAPGGALLITQEAWQGRPFKLQVGAWRDTGKFRRFEGGTVHHASGGYLVASDEVWRPKGDDGRGLGMFFQYGEGPPSVARVHWHYGGGLVWMGPTASRAHDELGITFSDDLLTKQNSFTHGFENEFEGYYRIYVGRGLIIQPDMEYYIHPDGGGTPNTALGLVRVMYSF